MNPQEEYSQHLYRIGHWHSQQLGLSADDGEDCTMEFVAQMLRLYELDQGQEKFCSNAWLQRCARHHARNWLRALRRRQQWYTPAPYEEDQQGGGAIFLTAPALEELFLCRVFWKQLLLTLRMLAEIPGSIFVGYYLKGYRVQELAQMFDMTPNAVEQSLLRSRRRLRRLLEQKGWNAATVDEHLVLLGCEWIDVLFEEGANP